MVNAAGLAMLNFAPKEPEEEWAQENIHKKQLGLCLDSAASSKGGYGILASSSNKTDLRVYSTAGRLLGAVDTGGLNNYMAAISPDGRFVAAATFTSDVKVRGAGQRPGQRTGRGGAPKAEQGRCSLRLLARQGRPGGGDGSGAGTGGSLHGGCAANACRHHAREAAASSGMPGLAAPTSGATGPCLAHRMAGWCAPACRLLSKAHSAVLLTFDMTRCGWTSSTCCCSCLQVYEVTFDRLGAFTGVKPAFSLKGHKSKVGCLTWLAGWLAGVLLFAQTPWAPASVCAPPHHRCTCR